MGIADDLRTQDEQRRTSEMSAAWTSRQEAVEQQVRTLTDTINDMTTQQAIVGSKQMMLLEQVQQLLERPSTGTADDARQSERHAELVKLQQQLAESLAGEDVHHAVETLKQATNGLARTARSVSASTTDELARTREELSQLRGEVAGFRRSVTLEAERASAQLTEATKNAGVLVERVERLGRWSWALSAQLLAGGLLLLIMLALLTGLLTGFAQLIGVPDISGAIWDAYAETDPWWGKTLWAGVGLGFGAFVVYGAWWFTRRLVDRLR